MRQSGGASPEALRPARGGRPMTATMSDDIPARDEAGVYRLRLYVAGQTARSLTALSNLDRICRDHLAGRYSLEVIDLLKQPQLAAGDQILAIPTLIRALPEPARRIIGDLSNMERVLVGLDLLAHGTER